MYRIREVVLKHNKHIKKRLVIEFDDPDKALVGEFLMVDAPLDEWAVLDGIDKVLKGEVPEIELSGNRSKIVMTPDKTYVHDLFLSKGDVPKFPSCELDTEILRELILMWKKEKEKYR